ncbi:MAG: hypothetical protein KDA20_04815 [Phycisphaerales bacterium]|nr:hypothetical protein [Phycisphaerales bacterium]
MTAATDDARGRLQVQLNEKAMMSVRDRASGQAILAPNQQALWQASGLDGAAGCVQPGIEVREVVDGFDVTYTYHNDTGAPKRLGTLYVGGVQFGPIIRSRVFDGDGREALLDHADKPFFGGGNLYPGGLYSPVATLRESDLTIGVSLLYPVLEYKHPVFVRVESPGGVYRRDGANWQVMFRLDADPSAPGILPGETRTYTVTCRFASGDPQFDWLRTLVPYRDYFRKAYGHVQYERDPRPIRAVEVANSSALSKANPRGFTYPEQRSPEVFGWEPWIDTMRAATAQTDVRRFMLVAPTGMFFEHRDLNYPFQFTSGWKQLRAARFGLATLSRFGKELGPGGFGLWWGRCAQVMQGWDEAEWTLLDPDNAAHRAMAFHELDLAQALHASVVGLDTISRLPAWKAYHWLKTLRARYPEMKFVVEPLGADFLHTLAASYVYGTGTAAQVRRIPTGPFLLADFLNPGHETWARIDATNIKREAGLAQHESAPEHLVRRKAVQLANWGYVPILHAHADVRGVFAAPSWDLSIPVDIRELVSAHDDAARQKTNEHAAQ